MNTLSKREKLLLLFLLVLLVGSVLYHNHPRMDGLQAQLETKAPALFKLFSLGEAVYFAGMILMALGLGKSLGGNLLTWPGKLRDIMTSTGQPLANARLFWFGFACNVVGSMTFASIGLYVAAEILPSGSRTLIPACLIDMAFTLAVRYAFYRRFARAAEAED